MLTTVSVGEKWSNTVSYTANGWQQWIWLSGLLLVLVQPVFCDVIYHWVDDDGIRHYSDRPPQNVDKEEITEIDTGLKEKVDWVTVVKRLKSQPMIESYSPVESFSAHSRSSSSENDSGMWCSVQHWVLSFYESWLDPRRPGEKPSYFREKHNRWMEGFTQRCR